MTENEREELAKAWLKERVAWVREQLEGGVWQCPRCQELVRLTTAEEKQKVAVRCTGVLDQKWNKDTTHWPTLMDRVGDIVWEVEVEAPERSVPMVAGPDWRTKLELDGEDE